MKPPERAIDYNQAYPAEMWNDETRKWEIIIRRNIHAVARWPTVHDLGNSSNAAQTCIRILVNNSKPNTVMLFR